MNSFFWLGLPPILGKLWALSGGRRCSRFKGVGPKTVACIMMFGLQRYEFPVDTHVWRIAKALGWVPAKATREQAYLHLNARVPDAIKSAAHHHVSSWCCRHTTEPGPCCMRVRKDRRDIRRMRKTQDQPACAQTLCLYERHACRYDLHVLLVEHGKRCPRCAKIPGRNRKEPVGECPLKRVQMVPCDKEPSAVASTAEPGGKRKRKMTL